MRTLRNFLVACLALIAAWVLIIIVGAALFAIGKAVIG